MGSEEELNVKKELNDIKDSLKQITENELVHINERLLTLENHVKAPRSTFYLVAAFTVFVGVLGVMILPAPVGWPLAGVCGAVLVLSVIGIKKLPRI